MPNLIWPSLKTIVDFATVGATIFAAASAGLSYRALNASVNSNQAAQRNLSVGNVATAVGTFFEDRNNPVPLIFALHLVAKNQTSGLLGTDDITFVERYLESQKELKGDHKLCCVWRDMAATMQPSEELKSLVNHATPAQKCDDSIKLAPC